MHTSTCRQPRPRSNTMPDRSAGRRAAQSGPSSVRAARRLIAQRSLGRQSDALVPAFAHRGLGRNRLQRGRVQETDAAALGDRCQ